MPFRLALMSRRHFTRAVTVPLFASWQAVRASAAATTESTQRAQIAISLDLEMSRNFPTWDQTHWDSDKGNLDADTKRYAIEAARRVKAHGGRLHFFLVGRTLEQENVDWLKELIREGHPIGNHTYDHVNLKATRPGDLQVRFQREPWLLAGRALPDVIRENIRLTSEAMKTKLGIDPAGFRSPGGFENGLTDRRDLQDMLIEQGFSWISSQYPARPLDPSPARAGDQSIEQLIAALNDAQSFVYPSGLVEIPMSPSSDVAAFRNGRWKLDQFLQFVRRGVEWAIRHKKIFVFTGHPSCLCVKDPHFKAVELICTLVNASGGKAALVTLEQIAQRIRNRAQPVAESIPRQARIDFSVIGE